MNKTQGMDSNEKPGIFLSVISSHKGILYKIANSYCKESEDRKDLVQEIMIQLWKSFDNYNSQYQYSTWIYRIALNVAISFYRKENSRKQVANPLSDEILNFVDPELPGETEQHISLLQKFISELKELDKALMLLYLEEKSYKEIAEIIGISETNVATKIGRIKIILKQKFEKYNAMEDTEIINLWKSYNKKLDESLQFNMKNAEDIIKLKVKSFLASMKPVKIFTIITGILWVAFVDVLIVGSFSFASPFFLVSAAIQVLLTKLAIGIYIYQLVLIHQVDISQPVLATQEKLARLKSSTLWVTRLLFLQFPVWTTFFLNKGMFENGNYVLYAIPVIITLIFTWMAIWLFNNIKYANRDKKWFRLIFRGKEWDPLMKAMELLNQVDGYKEEELGVRS